ncbi:MAG: hypothetical protein LUD74_08350 [Tannerellaceae bacterium]|nr:hypothetical protein [Tannerellaceae bacterium]
MRLSLVRLKLRLYLLLTVVYLVVGALGAFLLHTFVPQDHYEFFPEIGVFYWIAGLLLNYAFDHCRSNNPDKLLNVYMFGKVLKFVATVFLLLIYVLLGGENKVAFGIALMGNFIIFSILEVYIYYLYNKRLNRRKMRV